MTMGLFSFLKNKFGKKSEASVEPKKKDASLETYSKGMEKSRKNFASRLDELSKRYAKVNEEYFEELEQILIESDVGVELSLRLIEELLDETGKQKISDPKAINELLVDKMFVGYVTSGEAIQNELHFQKDGVTVLLICGVNGVGKTTTIAKLAYRYINQGKKVLLVAGDTFRAGAVEQLKVWANRLGCPIVTGKPESDPASVAYEGAVYANANGIDLMIVDTAGRQQTKANLMQELSKISRVLSKEIPSAPHEAFLVLDATTGQNALVQAKQFKEVTDLTGIILTKMDGTAKGGIAVAIQSELKIPVKYIGVGEKIEDLQKFDADQFVDALFVREEK